VYAPHIQRGGGEVADKKRSLKAEQKLRTKIKRIIIFIAFHYEFKNRRNKGEPDGNNRLSHVLYLVHSLCILVKYCITNKLIRVTFVPKLNAIG
jgi:hypothetical protein